MNLTGKQQLTLLLAGLLAAAHLWQGGTLGEIGSAIWNPASAEQPNPTPYLSAPVKDVLVSLGFVAVMGFISGLSDEAGGVSIAFLVALWMVFLFNTGGHPFTKPTTTSSSAMGTPVPGYKMRFY